MVCDICGTSLRTEHSFSVETPRLMASKAFWKYYLSHYYPFDKNMRSFSPEQLKLTRAKARGFTAFSVINNREAYAECEKAVTLPMA